MVRPRSRLSRCALAFLLVLVALPVLPQSPSAVANESASIGSADGPTDAAEVEAFFDGLMRVQLRHLDTAGATVSIVRDGQILFAKGYGYADLDAGMEVDAERTLFRIGSVSKLFVWISVMQLVEEGLLDLDADVNDYLAPLETVEVPKTWKEPVTLRHLMTHTPGFEDRVIGLFGRESEDLEPLSKILRRQTPERVRAPGDQPSYSNHGTAMAALIVETVAGRPWSEIVDERILEPLGMSSTTFAQPLPEELAARMSKGYRFTGDGWGSEPFELVPLYPVGAASATATDMARFMIALLGDGHLDERRILEVETARRMRQALLSIDPEINSSPHGFMDMTTRDVRILGHGGDTFWFHTLLAIFPEQSLGLFVSYNTDEGQEGRGPLLQAFLDRYFTPLERPGAPPADFAERAHLYAGEYRANRFAHSTLTKLGAAAGAFKVYVSDDGELLTLESRFIETAPRVFTEHNGERRLVFVEGEGGRMSHFYNARFPIVTFERVPAGESRRLHLTLLVMAVAAFLGTLVAWPGGWATRKWFRVRQDEGARLSSQARLALWATAAMLLGFVVGLLAEISNPTDIAFGDVGGLQRILALPFIALLPGAVAVWESVRAWRQRAGTRTGRVLYLLVLVVTLVFYWQLSVWNLLGWKL